VRHCVYPARTPLRALDGLDEFYPMAEDISMIAESFELPLV
jgi:hypothetical protein